jgi:protein required for attachment to host cells
VQETSQKQGKRKEKKARRTAPTGQRQDTHTQQTGKQKRSGKQTRNKSGKKTRREKSPLGYEHINFLGHYSFTLPADVANGQLRALRNPDELDL